MKHVRLSDARNQIAELLDEVERGETLMISREGEKAAQDRLAAETERDIAASQAMREILEMRKTAPRATVEELLQWRDEGRRY